MAKTTVVVKDFVARGRHFVIIRRDDFTISNGEAWYLAIEDKYITDGKLNTKLNGFQMHANRDLSNCLESTRIAVEIDYMKDNGATETECIKYIMDQFKSEEVKV